MIIKSHDKYGMTYSLEATNPRRFSHAGSMHSMVIMAGALQRHVTIFQLRLSYRYKLRLRVHGWNAIFQQLQLFRIHCCERITINSLQLVHYKAYLAMKKLQRIHDIECSTINTLQ